MLAGLARVLRLRAVPLGQFTRRELLLGQLVVLEPGRAVDGGRVERVADLAIDGLARHGLQVVVAAGPHGGGQLAGESDEPRGGHVVVRARLAAELVAGALLGDVEAADVAQDRHQLPDVVRVDDLVALRVGDVVLVAGGVRDLQDGARLAVQAVRGDGGVRAGQGERGHRVLAEQEGRVVRLQRGAVQGTGDAQLGGEARDVAQVQLVRGGDGRGVHGPEEALVHAHLPQHVRDHVLELPGAADRGVAARAARGREARARGVDVPGGVHGVDQAVAVAQPRQGHEGLERGAGLEALAAAPLLVHIEVQRGVAELVLDGVLGVLGHGADVAGAGLHRGERVAGAQRLVVGHGGAQVLLGLLLERRVDRRADGESAAVQQGLPGLDVRAERGVGKDLPLHVVAEVGAELGVEAARGAGLHHHLHRLGDGVVVLLLGEVAVVLHRVQHEVAPLRGLLRIAGRVEPGGGLDHAGQRGGLPALQVGGGLAEHVLRGGLDPVGAAGEQHDVEVALEDLVLRHLLLDGDGELDLLDLVRDVLGAGEGEAGVAADLLHVHQHVVHELLGEGGGALRGVGGGVVHGSADEAARVHAVVIVEALVLDGHDRVLHVLRDLVQRDRGAVLLVEDGDLLTVLREDARRHGDRLRGQLVRQLVQHLPARRGGDTGQARDGQQEGRHEQAGHRREAHEGEEAAEGARGRGEAGRAGGHGRECSAGTWDLFRGPRRWLGWVP
ncbi:Uncharacterised protein [Streptococcus pneumoniae]|nr:Uncharacterised protein [Streptococcus pneumoniae]